MLVLWLQNFFSIRREVGTQFQRPLLMVCCMWLMRSLALSQASLGRCHDLWLIEFLFLNEVLWCLDILKLYYRRVLRKQWVILFRNKTAGEPMNFILITLIWGVVLRSEYLVLMSFLVLWESSTLLMMIVLRRGFFEWDWSFALMLRTAFYRFPSLNLMLLARATHSSDLDLQWSTLTS